MKLSYLIFLVLSCLSTACEHYQPMDFPPQNGGRPKPGLFSGTSGAFEIPLDCPESALP